MNSMVNLTCPPNSIQGTEEMAEHSDFAIKWELLISDAWGDPALKQRLQDDPETVFKERGIKIPDGVSLKVHASSDTEKHLVIPTQPPEEELSEEQLEAVAGGGHSHSSHHSQSSHSSHACNHSQSSHSSHNSHSSHSSHHSHHSHFC